MARTAKKNQNGQAGNAGGANLGFEAKLFLAADKLRGNMDAAEYKHVTLGLIFLKYISDAFTAKRDDLIREAADPASDEARAIRDEVGFFQTVRAALAKTTPGKATQGAERDFAVQQIVSRAVVSTEIVDILKAAGVTTPDISILSDEFLAEVAGIGQRNLAMEALRKLLNGEIRSRSKVNVVQTKAFSQRLEEAIARYHTNAITTAQVIQELIQLARDIQAARARGEEQGLSDDEIAFYDALAANESAVEVMGDEQLRVIAHELLTSLRSNASVDWRHRESARAKMRVLVKRILRKYGYPPDLQDAAVQTVLQQAEALAERWAA